MFAVVFHTWKARVLSRLQSLQRHHALGLRGASMGRAVQPALAESDISVSKAWYCSGFNNLNYFIRQFKRIEGITPKAFQGI